MGARWMVLGLSVAIALSACSGHRGGGGGGGGGGGAGPRASYEPTHDRSNPTTREQRTQGGALPLQAVPQGGRGDIGDDVTGSKTAVVAQGGNPTFKVDINSASVGDLMRIPGMSDNLARAIVNNRPYRDALDVVHRIPNLDPRLMRAYGPYLTYGGGKPS